MDDRRRRHGRGFVARRAHGTRDPELGADLTAETFACVLEGLERFDPDRGSAVNWLFGIARHQLLHTLQRGSVERRARDRLGMPRIELDDEDLERILTLAESESTAALLADALDALPPEQRAALDARVLAEWKGACDMPRAVLIPATGGRPLALTDDASRAMGWTTDGRAIVFHFVGDRCDLGDEAALQLVTTEGRPIVLGKAARLDLPRSINPRDIKEIIGAA